MTPEEFLASLKADAEKVIATHDRWQEWEGDDETDEELRWDYIEQAWDLLRRLVPTPEK